MERAPSRAKATNILRPASRAQGATFSPDPQLKQQQQQQQQSLTPNGQPSARVLPGGARLLVSSAAGGAMQPLVGMPGMPGMALNSPGLLRRAPSAAQFSAQPLDPSLAASFGAPDYQQQQPLSAGIGGRNRLSSYHEGALPSFGDPAAAVPRSSSRSASRSGSRAELGPLPNMMGPQMQQMPMRSSSRAGYPSASGPAPGIGGGAGVGVGGGGMWGGQFGPMGMNTMFGGGFGSLGGDMINPASPMALQHQQQMMMMMNTPPNGRPGSSLQMTPQPARPATSTGFRSSGGESDSPMVVNVARGGARVIGPMRAKPSNPDQPSFLNPIPQSPSSALGALIPEPNAAASSYAARDHVRSALSNDSLGSAHSRSNSLLPPTEESMEAAEARVSRKIQDLEISNKSLLAVNTQLEARVKTQRDQISELKKQLQTREPLVSDSLLENDISDEALRSTLKEDKVFERLISNLEHLIQDAKAAIEYRSTLTAGKVINTMDMNEEDSQLTVGKSPNPQDTQNAEGVYSNENGGEKVQNHDGKLSSAKDDDNDDDDDNNSDIDHDHSNDTGAKPKNEDSADKPESAEAGSSEPAVDDAKLQEARELIARLMVLALSSPEPTAEQLPAPEKAGSRIPRRTGSGPGATAANAGSTARPSSALKGGLRTPMRSSGTRISSFGVASASTPVRSTVVSPTPSGKASTASGGGKDAQGAAANEREQILDICRKLQQIL
ncbi:hypothetical protein FB645_002200 [Coemansia sp. IMI 203386]|nr:hypothetical protein FB645_002200 [Coemansia sp. IMI 203386]